MTVLIGQPVALKAGYVSVTRLHPTPDNRPDGSGDDGLEGLAATIRVLGVLQSLEIEPMEDRPGHYWIRDGWRRWMAATMAGLKKVPATVFAPLEGLSEAAGAALVAVVTNHKAPLGPVEMAMKLDTLVKEGMSRGEIAAHTGLSAQAISYHLQLAKADEETLKAVREGRLTAGSVHDLITDMLPDSRQPRGRAGRRQQGRPRPARAAAYFNAGHRLAPAAHTLCKQNQHPAADMIGRVACGPCWELAIRRDQDEHARLRGDVPVAAMAS
jgi:ParB/RepB/Spo0J family partition protein